HGHDGRGVARLALGWCRKRRRPRSLRRFGCSLGHLGGEGDSAVIPDPIHLSAAWIAGTAGASALLAWAAVGGIGLRLLLAAVVGAGGATLAVIGSGTGASLVVAGLAAVVLAVLRPRWGVDRMCVECDRRCGRT